MCTFGIFHLVAIIGRAPGFVQEAFITGVYKMHSDLVHKGTENFDHKELSFENMLKLYDIVQRLREPM